jgi:hypothetical protein
MKKTMSTLSPKQINFNEVLIHTVGLTLAQVQLLNEKGIRTVEDLSRISYEGYLLYVLSKLYDTHGLDVALASRTELKLLALRQWAINHNQQIEDRENDDVTDVFLFDCYNSECFTLSWKLIPFATWDSGRIAEADVPRKRNCVENSDTTG